MGGNLARQALEKGLHVVGVSRREVPPDLVQAGLVPTHSIAEIAELLPSPRAVFLYVPAGQTVDAVIGQAAEALGADDIIVDGGNSHWRDSIRRHELLKQRAMKFVDVGTSGGLPGARHGACFMVGGERTAVRHVEPILRMLSVEGGYVHAGGPGAGHFVKLVHNGIEFGMLQAIAEGLDLLEAYPEKMPIDDVLSCWRNGSVIRSWLIDLMEISYRDHTGLRSTPPFVEDTGEVNWLVDDAMRLEVSIPVIAQSVMQLIGSRDKNGNAARAIAMMRHGFGGHPFGHDEKIARERQEGRIGGVSAKI
jgi:6-phosphogluconate dehydrogenase